jgi:hypothetical protein
VRNIDDNRVDDVDKFLSEEKAVEDRRQTLIAGLLKQKEAAIKAFDAKLAKLGYAVNSAKAKRSHHKKVGQPAVAAAPARDKAKA